MLNTKVHIWFVFVRYEHNYQQMQIYSTVVSSSRWSLNYDYINFVNIYKVWAFSYFENWFVMVLNYHHIIILLKINSCSVYSRVSRLYKTLYWCWSGITKDYCKYTYICMYVQYMSSWDFPKTKMFSYKYLSFDWSFLCYLQQNGSELKI